jgi:hypothetical protein
MVLGSNSPPVVGVPAVASHWAAGLPLGDALASPLALASGEPDASAEELASGEPLASALELASGLELASELALASADGLAAKLDSVLVPAVGSSEAPDVAPDVGAVVAPPPPQASTRSASALTSTKDLLAMLPPQNTRTKHGVRKGPGYFDRLWPSTRAAREHSLRVPRYSDVTSN